ncbi:MAG: uroporphyrinogen decarboxylase family protein [Candidatus Omnitrophota bacterium]
MYNVELFLDVEMQQACGDYFGIKPAGDDWESMLRWRVELHRRLGYETVRVSPSNYDWPTRSAKSADTTGDGKNRGARSWQDEGIGPITSREDFEKYPWPDPAKADFKEFEWCEKNLPEGMCSYALTAHILEYVMWLMGYEGLSMALYDQPDLVDAMFSKVGKNLVEFTRRIGQYKKMGIVWGSDDMGFKTGCMISPQVIIEKSLPWHARCAEIAHEYGKLYFLHSCGQLDDIMDPLIENVKIDAKHSWEDVILPVTEAKKKWGKRIGILGGIDVHFLCTATEADVRKRVRETLDACLSDGGYCLGTGNSVANYIPMTNYIAMLDEGRNYC